jgi:prepilin-type N-terminal cleavage/methylation domain-containing protein
MRRNQGDGFTLVELLIVVSVIVLLMTLLMSAITQARQSARHVICLSNQKHLAIATITYTADHDGYVPPANDSNNQSWADTMMPWVGDDEDAYFCPIHFFPKRRSGHFGYYISYCPNGHQWLFYAEWGAHWTPPRGLPTNLNAVRNPEKLMLMREDMEDWGLAVKQGRPNNFLRRHGNYRPGLFYFQNANPASYSSGGRHFRGGGTSTTDSWGFDTISFYDGHVITESMQVLVQRQSPDLYWYEFPFVSAAGQQDSSYANFVPKGPQPGAQWWTYPGW